MPDRSDNRPPPPPTGDGDVRRAAFEGGDARTTRQHLDTDALSAFIDDRLDGDLSLAASGHIAACPDCRSELAELQATVALLGGLPQYRLRRSFALGLEYAHPVRTSRLVRLLPLLPVLRSAAVAVLLLLVGVGAADVLTQIGEDSGAPSRPAAMADQTAGETAMQPDTGAVAPDGEQNSAANDVPAGDGTGGDGFAPESEYQPAPGISGASSATDDVAPGSASSGGLDAERDGAGAPAADDAERVAADAPISAAPNDAQQVTAREAEPGDDTASAASPRDESLGEVPAAPVPANNDARGVAAESAPAPTVAIATEAAEQATDTALAQADATGATNERAGSRNDSGISNWRLIEYVLTAALVALVVLVVSLNRLSVRARRIGAIR